MSVNVVIVDDHQLVRDGLTSLLQGMDADIEVIGQGGSGEDAVALAKSLQPDIMLLDVAMPDMNGIDATHAIRHAAPDVRIIAVSMHAERMYVTGMLDAGAMAYIRKESAFDELSHAFADVLEGKVYLGEGIADIVMSKRRHDPRKTLTEREIEVLRCIADGMKTREIAAKLFVSEKTIETHRRQISRKTRLHSVAELTKYALRNNLTTIN
ncbi:MAG: response regulator transcription factor [Pseudomonadota bacterium]